ncbi:MULTISPECIES: entericidin A/B family lipoprotein [Paracoccus]|uniref:Entericidin A/B family lipoprotein n=1 Tax=Paracoccus litorisediminis TaxID=2006130 RepID=A0A844HEY8_9RHOB|nr:MULTISPECIES: entericidin A/B family lipoprotein [Paracoccus]MBD9525692.1 entericidin A/B family lipoprotein [Paracoccus sp. PAR01]MTH58143.1 entericidin A/B family lipoprotein [Paracoccus litorisediminis]
MRRILHLAPILAVMAVSACETMQGAGRDMQTAGALLTDQAATSQTQMGQQPYTAPAPY